MPGPRVAFLWLAAALTLTAACTSEADEPRPDASASDSSLPVEAGEPSDVSDAAVAVTDDAGSSADAAPPDAAASAQCAPVPDPLELLVFDSAGPSTLIGELKAYQLTRALTGTVIQQGTGLPSEGVPTDVRPRQHPEQFRFVRIRGSEHTWTIALRNVPSFGVRDGDAVSVQLRFQYGSWSPSLMGLSLRVSGQLSFFYAQGGDVESLMVPTELGVEQGPALCTQRDECGSWSDYALAVRDVASGGTVMLEPGATAQVGAFDVIHGGDSQQLPGSAGCLDWFVSRAELLAYRREPVPSPTRCATSQATTRPGVRIEFPDDVACRFSLSQAAAGIEIPYAVVVDDDVPMLTPGETPLSICTPNDALPADLLAFEELSGNQQLYALRDQGLCPMRTPSLITLRAGRYPHTFRWDGRNWTGPSDTGVPKGPPFPAGTYTLKIKAAGSAPTKLSGSIPEDFELNASLELTLTP